MKGKRLIKENFESYLSTVSGALYCIGQEISSKRTIEFDDARQELLISVWKAYQKFDPNKNFNSNIVVLAIIARPPGVFLL